VSDIDHNQVSNIENAPDELEVFPCWAPDGKTLYYCSAHFEYNDSLPKDAETIMRAKEIKYSIYKKSFDPETLIFGPRELVYDAAGMDMSATLPRVSPDGKYLLFTLGHYGCFHIWHHEADLWLLNLETSESRIFDEVNSPDTESYHSWSSNGRWIIFSSRRDDGGYTRLFIAHVDANGKATKPFEVPQADPNYNREFMKSYNIPEFMKGAVTLTPAQVADVLKGDGRTPVEYVSKLKKQ
jgi:Tol biopolymer transport system component